jgi:hypothetical protein
MEKRNNEVDENALLFNPCLDDVSDVSAFRRDLVIVDQVALVVKLT